MKTYTIIEYEKKDYDNFENDLTKQDVINGLRSIARGWLPDYNYTGTEEDFDDFKNQAIMRKAIKLLEGRK